MPDWMIAIVTSTLVAIVGYFGLRYQYRKDRTDLAEQLREMATKLTADLESERTKRRELEARLDEIDDYIDGLLDGIKILIRQLEDARMEPCWKPGDRPVRKAKV